MVTVEAAISLTAILAVTSLLIAGIGALVCTLIAYDSAAGAARAYVIGIDYDPPVGEVTVTESGGLATATATVASPLGTMHGRAVFALESC